MKINRNILGRKGEMIDIYEKITCQKTRRRKEGGNILEKKLKALTTTQAGLGPTEKPKEQFTPNYVIN